MTRDQHPAVRSVIRRLRLSPGSFAGAAAACEPGLLVQLQAAQHAPAVGALTRGSSNGSALRRRRPSVAGAPRYPA